MMIRRKVDCSAIVLCGGKSVRAGFDKQTIRIEGKPIAAWIADELLHAFDNVILATNQPMLYDSARYRVVQDIIPNMGPLGGIHAGLINCESEYAFVTACDMPNIHPGYLRLLKREAQKANQSIDAVAVRLDNGMLEPLNALYARRVLPLVEQMLLRGERKASDLLRQSNTRYLSEPNIKPFGGRAGLFYNMNTSDEISAYLGQLQTQQAQDNASIVCNCDWTEFPRRVNK